MSLYTEDTLVQQTTAEYLEQELGWESVYAYNNEWAGQSIGSRVGPRGGVEPHSADEVGGTEPWSTCHGI